MFVYCHRTETSIDKRTLALNGNSDKSGRDERFSKPRQQSSKLPENAIYIHDCSRSKLEVEQISYLFTRKKKLLPEWFE